MARIRYLSRGCNHRKDAVRPHTIGRIPFKRPCAPRTAICARMMGRDIRGKLDCIGSCVEHRAPSHSRAKPLQVGCLPTERPCASPLRSDRRMREALALPRGGELVPKTARLSRFRWFSGVLDPLAGHYRATTDAGRCLPRLASACARIDAGSIRARSPSEQLSRADGD